MRRRHDPIRQAVAVWSSALLLTLSVVVPLLERVDLLHEPVVESEHNPATCPPAHDHTICTQVGASVAVVSTAPQSQHHHRRDRRAIPTTPAGAVPSALAEGHPTRAPPRA